MPPNRTQYENLAILKTPIRRNLMHLASRLYRDLDVPCSGGNKQYSKDQVKVCPAVIHYKGVNGVLETRAVRCNGAVLHHKVN